MSSHLWRPSVLSGEHECSQWRTELMSPNRGCQFISCLWTALRSEFGSGGQ